MKISKNVICPFCGCLCDDLSVTIDNNRIISVDNGCALANAKFLETNRLNTPLIRENNKFKETDYEEAIQITADILKDAERPLLFGWSGTHGEAQCAGVHLYLYQH